MHVQYVIFSLKQNGAKIQLEIPDLKKLKNASPRV